MGALFLREAGAAELARSTRMKRPPSMPNLARYAADPEAAASYDMSGTQRSMYPASPPVTTTPTTHRVMSAMCGTSRTPASAPSASRLPANAPSACADTAAQLIALKVSLSRGSGAANRPPSVAGSVGGEDVPTGMAGRRPPSIAGSVSGERRGPASVPSVPPSGYLEENLETESLLSIPISVRSRFGSRKFRTLSVGANMLAYGNHVVPFAKIEWASCTGDDSQAQSMLLIKEASRSRPHGLIFASTEQRDLVTARLAEWDVQQAPSYVQDPPWTSGSSDNTTGTATQPQLSGRDWPEGIQGFESDADSDGGGDVGCCAHIREDGVCVCHLGCCHFKMRAGGEGVGAKLESAFRVVHKVVRKRSLEIAIFGLLMPLALATALYVWALREHKIYDRPWLEAECKILSMEEQSHRLYQNGDYLRNSHPNDGVYYVLQPAWRSLITPHPHKGYYQRDRNACCRQSHAQAHLPASIEHVDRSPTHPWVGLVWDEVVAGKGQRCQGNIAVSLAETRAICHRDMYWTLPETVLINSTYPCWYVAHGATHVYLNVEPQVLSLLATDVLAIVMVVLAILSLAVRASTT